MDHNVSSILMGLPLKRKEPSALMLSCTIGKKKIDGCPLDLGASINLMPYSIYQELETGELQPSQATLQLADRSIRYPEGFVEDVLIQVGEFVFPVDFTVLTMEAVDTTARKR